jgi:hypothetical protein
MNARQMRDALHALFPGDTWRPWRAAAAAVFALPPEPGEQELHAQCTGRATWPTRPAREAWFIVGRRGGKSVFATRMAGLLAFFRDYRPHLTAGEVGVAAIVAADRGQARVDFRYVSAMVDSLPKLSARVVSRTQDRLELDTRVAVEVTTCTVRAPRGRTVIVAVCDEVAFWQDDAGSNPDREVLAALRPAMSTIPDGLLLCCSTPYARRGALWQAHRDHYGKDDGAALVWVAPSRVMNPLLAHDVIDAAYAADEASARSEYGAEFRSDVEGFISAEALDAVVVRGRRELAPVLS